MAFAGGPERPAGPPQPRGGDYRDRIARLSDKLCVLHEGIDHDQGQRSEHLQGKLRQLDERVSATQDDTSKKFSALREQLVVFQQELGAEQQARLDAVRRKEEEISQLDRSLRKSLQTEQSTLRATEESVLKAFQAQTTALKAEIDQSGRDRIENEGSVRRHLEADIPRLYQTLKDEVDNREAMEKRLLARAMEEISGLQEAVLEEKRAREDSENAMLQMMEDVVRKMQAEIALEREKREKTEDTLLSMLHETCQKMEGASASLF